MCTEYDADGHPVYAVLDGWMCDICGGARVVPIFPPARSVRRPRRSGGRRARSNRRNRAERATPCWSGSDRSVLAAGDGSGLLRHDPLRPLPRDRVAGDGSASRSSASCRQPTRRRAVPSAPTTDDAFVAAVSDREAITDHDVAAFVDVVQAAIGHRPARGSTTA